MSGGLIIFAPLYAGCSLPELLKAEVSLISQLPASLAATSTCQGESEGTFPFLASSSLFHPLLKLHLSTVSLPCRLVSAL